MIKRIIYSSKDIIDELWQSAYLLGLSNDEVYSVIPRIISGEHRLMLYRYDPKLSGVQPKDIYVYEFSRDGVIVSNQWTRESNRFLTWVVKRLVS